MVDPSWAAHPGWGSGRTGERTGQAGTHQPLFPQCGDFGAEGTDLWLAASGDQRVSVWASDWLRDHCELGTG